MTAHLVFFVVKSKTNIWDQFIPQSEQWHNEHKTLSLQGKMRKKRTWLRGEKSLAVTIAQAAWENACIKVAPVLKSPPLNTFVFNTGLWVW